VRGAPAIALSIGAGRHQLPFLRACAAEGFEVAAIDRDAGAPGFAHCAFSAAIPARGASARALDWVRALPRRPALVGCFSFGGALATRERIARALGLPALPARAQWLLAEKAAQLAALRARGLARRRAWRGPPPARALDPARRYLVKPARGGSSEGIRILAGAALLRAPVGEGELVEEFVEGPEFRLQVWVRAGRVAWLAQLARQNRPGSALLARLAPVAPPEPWAQALAADLVSSLGLREALLKLDVVRSEAGTELIEVDPGIAGDHFEAGVSQACYGIDTAAAYLDLLLGRASRFRERGDPGLVFDYLYHPGPGTRRVALAAIARALAELVPGARALAHRDDGALVQGPPRSNRDALCGLLRRPEGPAGDALAAEVARALDPATRA